MAARLAASIQGRRGAESVGDWAGRELPGMQGRSVRKRPGWPRASRERRDAEVVCDRSRAAA